MALIHLGQLTPALVSLSCIFDAVFTGAEFCGLLPQLAPHIVTLRLHGSVHHEHVGGILDLAAQRLPCLRELYLSSTTVGTPLPPAAGAHLSQLTSLQRLMLSGPQLVTGLAPFLPSAPALVSLHLPDAVLPVEPAVLAALTALTSVQLGTLQCSYEVPGGGGTRSESCLPAIRQMRSLQEFVFDASGGVKLSEDELRQQMVPPPPMLRTIVVPRVDRALCWLLIRVLGPLVDGGLSVMFSSTYASVI